MGGWETTEYLAKQGCQVSLVEMRDTIANGLSTTVLSTMLENYGAYGVVQYPRHKVTRMTTSELICEDKSGNAVQIPCDYVVMAIGARPVAFDTLALIDRGIAVVKIGDCIKVADISHATKTAYDAANAL